MERYNYDFHVHSCLSPCGDNDMTPNNMVNMAALLGCDIMAITDHNTCANVPAVMEAGKSAGILVVPGMELCTAEEAHVVCLFDSAKGALEFGKYISENIPDIKNKPEIFGDQLILDANDNIIGKEDRLLITSSFITVNDVMRLVHLYGGTAFPAHINKDSYSVVASLGVVPEEAGFNAVEITAACDLNSFGKAHPEIEGKLIVTDSDAHYLESLSENMGWIELPEKSLKALIAFLDGRGEGKLSPFAHREAQS